MNTFPIYKQSIKTGMIVKFVGIEEGVVMESGSSSYSRGEKSDSWYPCTNNDLWKDCSAEWLKNNVKAFEQTLVSLTFFQTLHLDNSSSTLTKVPNGYVMTSHSGHQIFIKENTKETL